MGTCVSLPMCVFCCSCSSLCCIAIADNMKVDLCCCEKKVIKEEIEIEMKVKDD